jgi:hypothetical protein
VLAEHSLEANLWRWLAAWRTIADRASRRPLASGGQAAADRARQKANAKAKRRR